MRILIKLLIMVFLLSALNTIGLTAKQVFFGEARGMLSRDYAMAQPVTSGTIIDRDGKYWLALFDKNGSYVRSESFVVQSSPPRQVNNYNDYYENVKYALKNFSTRLTLTLNDQDVQSYSGDIVKEICDAYPSQTFGYQQSQLKFINYNNSVTIELTFQYKFSCDSMIKMRDSAERKGQQIFTLLAKPGMQDCELELAIHDYLVKNTRYDEINFRNNTIPAVDYTDYGVLINGVAVCQGYSSAANRLLSMAGIPAMIISGSGKNGESHAWNLLKIRNDYCHLDCTYDDPVGVSDGIGLISHDYFNLSDKVIARDHYWNSRDYPRANTLRWSYYVLGYNDKDKSGNVYQRITSQNQLEAAIAAAITARRSLVTVNLMHTDGTKYDLGAAFERAVSTRTDAGQVGCKVSYTDSLTLNMWHVRIELEYS